MTTTELIKILKDNEYGGISHKPRELSLTINGKDMPNPQITLSSTGDGICGAEINLDVDGEFHEEQQPKTGHWIGHREHCEKLGVIPSGLGVYEWCSNCDYGIDIRDWSRISHNYCPKCGAKMQEVQK